MAKCTNCQAETELYTSGVPGCVRCTGDAERQPPQAEQAVRSKLLEEVIEATARVNAASETFHLMIGQFPSGLPHPDGSQRIKSASSELSLARKEMMRAHNRLNDFLSRGLIPEDLHRKG